MKPLGVNPLHSLLIMTEVPGRWAAWKLAPFQLLLALIAGWGWVWAAGDTGLGWGVALGLIAFALADWGLLAFLPRRGLSFGAVQPPWLGLVFFRWLIVMLALPIAVLSPYFVIIAITLLQVILWVLMAYGTLIGPFRLEVTHLEVPNAKPGNPHPGAPIRIVQLSDIHVERLTPRDQALPRLVADLAPDLIVLTGDFLSTSYNEDPRAVEELRSLLKQFHAPAGIYAIWGTAEVDRPEVLRPALEELGIVVLENQSVEVQAGGRRLWLMGVYPTRDLVSDGKTLRRLLDGAPSEASTLLLYHTPDLMPQAAEFGVDLYLAGHTHGGQWRVPGFGAILTSSVHGKRYEAGHFQEGKTHLYVSRGLGLEGFGAPRARFFCPPEVVAVTLSAAGQRQ
jgi:predicted MPP superfamily phosphohydrolase